MLKGFLILGLAAAALAPTAASAQTSGAADVAPPEDTRLKEARLQAQILEQVAEGALADRRARRLLRDLDEVRRIDAFYRSPLGQGPGGGMTEAQRRDIIERLDLVRGGLYAELAQGTTPRRP